MVVLGLFNANTIYVTTRSSPWRVFFAPAASNIGLSPSFDISYSEAPNATRVSTIFLYTDCRIIYVRKIKGRIAMRIFYAHIGQ